MQIRELETFTVAPPNGIGGAYWLLVRITTDDGIQGIGECYGIPFAPRVAEAMVHDTFARFFEGQDPHAIELLFRRCYSAGFTQRPDVSLMGVFSGLETALWDILGKAADQPVYNLLGGAFHDRLRTYSYIYPPGMDTVPGDPIAGDVYHDAEAAAKRAIDYLKAGFTAIKQDPAGPYGMQGGRELSLFEQQRSVRSLQALREAVGVDADLLFGTHGQMTTASAIRLARQLEPANPLWFEEPCPPDQLSSLTAIAASTSIPIATGERLTTRVEFHEALRAGVRILQPDIGRSGGIWETKKIACLAELYNAQVAPHIYCGPVAHAAAAHVAFSSPSFLILETILTQLHQQLVATPLQWQTGYLLKPDAPGLGIELDDAVVAAHPVTDQSTLHLEMCQQALPSDNRHTVSQLSIEDKPATDCQPTKQT